MELLEACDELNFSELIDDLQIYLIKEKNEWILQNLIYIHRISSRHQFFSLIQDYCNTLVCESPEVFLKSNDITEIEKTMLISILERGDLELNEIDVWDYIVQWGIRQNQTLDKNISAWTKDDFKELKKILQDIIPLIRFKNISSNDFYDKINPYKKIIDKEIYNELFQYYINYDNWQPRLLLRKGPRTKGKLLNSQTKSLVSSWIEKREDDNNISYYFKLIYRGTQDGFSRTMFERKCYNIKQTIVIMKTKETDELIGGYNPVCWNIKEKPLNGYYWIKTGQSFIFKIDEDQLNDSTLSRVKTPKMAICHNYQTIDLVCDGIKFHEKTINFSDLQLLISTDNEPYCYYSYCSYENNLNFRGIVHLLEECEVYKLVKKKTI